MNFNLINKYFYESFKSNINFKNIHHITFNNTNKNKELIMI